MRSTFYGQMASFAEYLSTLTDKKDILDCKVNIKNSLVDMGYNFRQAVMAFVQYQCKNEDIDVKLKNSYASILDFYKSIPEHQLETESILQLASLSSDKKKNLISYEFDCIDKKLLGKVIENIEKTDSKALEENNTKLSKCCDIALRVYEKFEKKNKAKKEITK